MLDSLKTNNNYTVAVSALCVDELYVDALYVDALYVDALYVDALYVNALYVDALYVHALYVDALYVHALYVDALYADALYLDALYVDAFEAVSLNESIDAVRLLHVDAVSLLHIDAVSSKLRMFGMNVVNIRKEVKQLTKTVRLFVERINIVQQNTLKTLQYHDHDIE